MALLFIYFFIRTDALRFLRSREYELYKTIYVPSFVVLTDAVVSFVMPVSVVPVDSVDVTGSVDPVVFSCTDVVATKTLS